MRSELRGTSGPDLVDINAAVEAHGLNTKQRARKFSKNETLGLFVSLCNVTGTFPLRE
jgi:hypothetical protein